MSPLEDGTACPEDFTIQTPEKLQQILQNHFTRKHGYSPSRAMRLVLKLVASIRMGRLQIIMPNGQALCFKGAEKGPDAMIRIHDDRAARRFLTKGKLGFCEAYLDGDWSSPDITTFFELILVNADNMKRRLLGRRWARVLSYLAHIIQPNSKKGSRKNIYKHYDIGNDFYAEWLDPSMTYSSAYFADGITDLQEAQARKYEEMVRRMDLKPEHHVLEIGCGWGGFAEYAASKVGCQMTCLTVSPAQFEYAKTRIEKAGLSDKVEIRLQDYRDVTGTFDRIASIEMFEAVGEKYWPTYFETLRERLTPGGRAVLQIITIHEEDFPAYRKSADYIQRYIFPGGMLPSISALEEQINAADLRKGDILKFGQDYGRTLKMWNEVFQDKWSDLSRAHKMDRRFKRLWEQYFAYCEAGFRTGRIDVVQLAVHKDE